MHSRMTSKNAQNKVLILNSDQIAQKINRMAYQILEDNLEEKEVCVAGMGERGFILATKIKDILSSISNMSIHLLNVKVQSDGNVEVIDNSGLPFLAKNQIIVLVDDVLNSGKTLSYGFSAFLKDKQKKIRTAVLIDRSHKVYPIATDFVGLSLATILKEHIEVVLDNGTEADGVFIS